MSRYIIGLSLALLGAAPVTLHAQEVAQKPGPTAALRALAAQRSASDRDRATVAAFLERADVQRVAVDHDIDTSHLQEAVRSLDDGAVKDLARRVRAAESQPALVGGDTFVISSTAVIVALLIIILIQVS